MAEIGTQGQEIIVDSPDSDTGIQLETPGSELVSWIVTRVEAWRDHRNLNYNKRWAEYWRLWRGMWSEEDRNRLSERSRLIAPALAQAIEMSVAEVEEAVLSREVWFDIADDIADEEKLDATLMRDQLLEDMELVDAKGKISEAVLNAAIFGTGCLKVNVEVATNTRPVRGSAGQLETDENERVFVNYESFRPDQIIPDPAGKTVQEMLGIAFEHRSTPTHRVLEKIESGTYLKSALPYLNGTPLSRADEDPEREALLHQVQNDRVNIVEYHGKVPLSLLNRVQAARTTLDEILELDDAQRRPGREDLGPLVEAIVTYANDGVLLRAIPNPFTMRDRSVVTFAWEKVPGRFWGRGVAEKGYNPQKALDAEMRSRADALGFISAPMMGIDSGRIPRGFKPEVKPGKVWLTEGPPDEVLRPVQIGGLEPNTFNQTAELTQMVQMGTGAFDTATTLRGSTQSGGNAANSGSMLLGAFVKRSKRAIQNVDRQLLQPLIKKSALRYMQFDPTRYPFDDTKFVVKASLGIIAREVEQLNLTQLMAMLPDDFPQVKVAVAQGIMEMSSAVNKAQIIQAMEAAMAPPSPEEQQRQQKIAEMEAQAQEAELEGILLQNQKSIAEIRKLMAEAEVSERKADVEEVKVGQEQQRIGIQFQEIKQFEQQNEIAEKRLDLQEAALKLRARNQGN